VTTHTHSHGNGADGDGAVPDATAVARRRRAVRLMLVLLVPAALATLAGLVLLWPGSAPTAAQQAAETFQPPVSTYPHGTVASLQAHDCAQATSGGLDLTCATAVLVVAEGEGAGRYVQVELPPEVVGMDVEVGDELVLSRDPGVDGGEPTYQFQDFARTTPIVVLALAFVLVVGLVARLRGLLAILGLGFAFVVVLTFLLPALLAGGSPVWVTLVGSSAIMFVVLYLAHGFSARTTTALVGTLSGLALSAVLGAIAVSAARLTGFADENVLQLQQYDPTLDFTGLVLAGLVVAGLGVLNDVTITQASAVWQLHELSPEMGWRELFGRGMAIGRDHIASTIYTIVFAYAGAAMPLLLLFEIYQRPFGTVLTGSLVAEEVIRTLVGAIALVAAVPLTTAVGALVATAAATAPPAPPVPPRPSGRAKRPEPDPGAVPALRARLARPVPVGRDTGR
jgi:uncharacterized membrane protein